MIDIEKLVLSIFTLAVALLDDSRRDNASNNMAIYAEPLCCNAIFAGCSILLQVQVRFT